MMVEWLRIVLFRLPALHTFLIGNVYLGLDLGVGEASEMKDQDG